VKKIEAGPRGARIEFTDKPNIDPARIIALLQSAPRFYKLDGPSKLRITTELIDAESRIEALVKLFDVLAGTASDIRINHHMSGNKASS